MQALKGSIYFIGLGHVETDAVVGKIESITVLFTGTARLKLNARAGYIKRLQLLIFN